MKHLSILDAMSEGLIVVGSKGRIEFANAMANRMLGYKSNELHGLAVEVLVPKLMKHTHEHMRETYLQQPTARIMSEGRRLLAVKKNGSRFPVCISLTPGKVAGKSVVVVGLDDVSELEEIEQHKVRAQKLEALGEMVGGIAHNFNNLLAGISGYSYLMQSQNELDKSALAKMQSIDGLCQQAAMMIKQLMVYSRDDTSDLCATNIIPSIRQAIDLARMALPEHIELIEDFRIQGVQVMCEAGQIQQTIINVINNAAQAIGNAERGKIVVKLAECAGCGCGDKSCPVNNKRHDVADGRRLCVKIKDNGSGVEDEVIERVFDPFFTTKPVGQGTGLGLSTAYGAIGRINGHIKIKNRRKKGTEVQFYLPLIAQDTDVLPVSALTQTVKARAPATILLMDDDENILSLMSDIVEGLGYRTICASDGDEGVEAFRESEQQIDLVITDVAMPMLDGIEAMQSIRDMVPDVPCIYLTGYSDQLDQIGVQDLVMMKPFDMIELSRNIDQLLGSAVMQNSERITV
ncbi:MAG: ATP-binding protein [Mariprofundus sp.]